MRPLGHGGSADHDDGDPMVLDDNDNGGYAAPAHCPPTWHDNGNVSGGDVAILPRGRVLGRGSHDTLTLGDAAGLRRDSGDRDATGLRDEVGARDSGDRAATGIGREAGHGVSVHPLQGIGPLDVDMLARDIDHDDSGGGQDGDATGGCDSSGGNDNDPGLGHMVDHGASVRNLPGFGMRATGSDDGGGSGGGGGGGPMRTLGHGGGDENDSDALMVLDGDDDSAPSASAHDTLPWHDNGDVGGGGGRPLHGDGANNGGDGGRGCAVPARAQYRTAKARKNDLLQQRRRANKHA